MSDNKSLCKNCQHRFRRVFIPLHPENFIDDDGNSLVGEENIVIMNMCLISDMDLDIDSTVECTHYVSKDDGLVQFFRHKDT